MLMAIALLVRRYYVKEVTEKVDFFKFLACLFLVIGSSIEVTVLCVMKMTLTKVS